MFLGDFLHTFLYQQSSALINYFSDIFVLIPSTVRFRDVIYCDSLRKEQTVYGVPAYGRLAEVLL